MSKGILQILENSSMGEKETKAVYNEILGLLPVSNVSQQRELLLAWEEYCCKLEYLTPNYEVLDKNIDDFLEDIK